MSDNNKETTSLKSGDTQNHFEQTLNQVDGFIFQFTYNEFSDTYSFPFINGGLKSVYGFSAVDLKRDGRLAFNKVHEEDQPIMRRLIHESRDKLIPWEQDYRLYSEENGLRWLRGSAIPEAMGNGVTLWNGYISDISEIKKVESELLKSRERYEFALEVSQMGYWDWDLDSRKIFYSDKSLKILGLKRNEVTLNEDTWIDLVHPDDKEQYFNDIKDHLERLSTHYNIKYRILTADGVYKWIHDRGKVVESEAQGRPIRMIGTHLDVTKEKEYEQTILENNNIIQKHNDRLQNFALIVSHNLRNHAGNLVQILKLIEEADTPEEKEELSSYLIKVSVGLSKTIENLDELVANTEKRGDLPKVVNLKDFVDDAISTLKNKAEEKEVTVVNKVDTSIQVSYNTAYLESILYNLISNGIKYSDKEKESQVIIKGTRSSLTDILLHIEDNGLGIDLENSKNNLFGMYKTFHKNEDAKGLGLFMTKNQIVDMGDSIEVKSKKGEGSKFTVHFKNKLA